MIDELDSVGIKPKQKEGKKYIEENMCMENQFPLVKKTGNETEKTKIPVF